VLLETLSAEERAVFLLKEVFDYGHAEIAEILGTTSANSRQLFHRAKTKVRLSPSPRVDAAHGAGTSDEHASRKSADVRTDEDRRLVAERFADAFRSGNASQFTRLLAADVSFVADGGGKASAARRPLAGRDAVTSFLVGLHRSARATGLISQVALDVVEVNSEPAMVLRVGGQLDGVFVLTIEDRSVVGIPVVRNPDKLAFIKRQLGES
jgi:RNA polymerase sigma-70 factor (ECF subfamily)